MARKPPPPPEPPKPPRAKPVLRIVRDTPEKPEPKTRRKAPAKAAKPRADEHVPTPEQRQIVMLAAAVGIAHERICRLVGISSVNTLKKHYTDELETGTDRATLKVAGTLFAMATDKNHPRAATAGIFWMKAKAGWTDRGDAQDEDEDGDTGEGVEVVRIGIGGAKGGKA